jgi:hypothetical protein
MIADKVKLIVVRSGSPDVETQVGVFPDREAAMPAFRQYIAEADVLRVTIEPVSAERTDQNFASYQLGKGVKTQ